MLSCKAYLESRNAITTKAYGQAKQLSDVAIELPTQAARKPSTVSKADSAASDTCSAAPLVGISPVEVSVVVCVAPLGGGAGTPPEGMSPAKAGDERAHARITDIRNRFTDFLLLSRMQDFLHRRE